MKSGNRPRADRCLGPVAVLVEAAFGGTDVTNAFEKLIEVIGLPLAWGVFESFIVHGESLYQEFAQTSGRPLTELRATMASDAKADGKNNF